MTISRDEVRHVAKLARIEFSDDELDRIGAQLNDILAAVGKVSELDLGDVPPMSHPLDVVDVLGDDDPRPSLPRDRGLANAPETEDGYFVVPPT
jgi:aspartyl-tRNA(Asn)/glutamyl-tRNA(Gln) amidotransferase subunit C